MKSVKQFLIISILSIFIISFYSCNNKTRYLYKKQKRSTPDTTYSFHNAPLEYKIQPYDVLYLSIKTTNEDINQYFAQDDERERMGDNRFYFSGYSVNDTGYIQVPVLGFIKVEGNTIREARQSVQKKADEYVIDAIVNVKFVDFKISILGEVPNQGVQYVYQEKIDILEAIARAGGISNNGNKRNVIILRETDKGKEMFRVNLNDRDILLSENFYLYPNDMIIVEERPIRKFISENLRDFGVVLSITSTTLTTTLIILSLKK